MRSDLLLLVIIFSKERLDLFPFKLESGPLFALEGFLEGKLLEQICERDDAFLFEVVV